MNELALVPEDVVALSKPLTKRQWKEIAAGMWDRAEEEARWGIELCREELNKSHSVTERQYWMRLHKDYLDVYGKQATDMMKTEIVAEQIVLQGTRTFAPNSVVPQINGHQVKILPKEKEETNG